jgi:hypothetical protein
VTETRFAPQLDPVDPQKQRENAATDPRDGYGALSAVARGLRRSARCSVREASVINQESNKGAGTVIDNEIAERGSEGIGSNFYEQSNKNGQRACHGGIPPVRHSTHWLFVQEVESQQDDD